MAKEVKDGKKQKRRTSITSGGGGAVYGLGFIGVFIYYIQHATTFWLGLLGLIKAIFWPALLIYKLFELLKL